MRHRHQQRRDAAAHLLQSGQEPQLRHGASEFSFLALSVASLMKVQIHNESVIDLSVGLQRVPVLQEVCVRIKFHQLQSW